MLHNDSQDCRHQQLSVISTTVRHRVFIFNFYPTFPPNKVGLDVEYVFGYRVLLYTEHRDPFRHINK